MPSQASASSIRPSDVLAARKELARKKLTWFARFVDIPGAPISEDAEEDQFHTFTVNQEIKHHERLMEELQAVAEGKIRRLMVFMPPGSAKSTYCSVVFPAWMMGRQRSRQIIMASYGSELARKQGRRTRQLIRSKGYEALFNVGLTTESSAADEFGLTNQSEYMAGGLLSGLTGNRADGIIIDDPVKGREDADSENLRRKTRAAYDDDLLTRLKPGGWIVMIMTRWNQDDLAGSILPENWNGESGDIACRDGTTWRVLCIPAKADRKDDPLGRKIGEYLWPEWFDANHWLPFENNSRTWSALFQQKPSPEEGTFFKREWFTRRHDENPKQMHVYMTSDYAVTEGGGDYTEHAVWGLVGDDLYQLDWWSGQETADVWIEAKLDLIKRWKPMCVFGEAGVIEKAIRPMLKRRMIERKIHARIEWIPSVRDKPTRARAFQSRAAMGTVSLMRGAKGDDVLTQLLMFPAGKHDDKVDCCSLMGMVLDEAHPAIVIERPKAPARDMWADGRVSEGVDWKTA